MATIRITQVLAGGKILDHDFAVPESDPVGFGCSCGFMHPTCCARGCGCMPQIHRYVKKLPHSLEWGDLVERRGKVVAVPDKKSDGGETY